MHLNISIPIMLLIVAGVLGTIAIKKRHPHKKKTAYWILGISLTLVGVATVIG